MNAITPLVSILIPTHNRLEYFKIALQSAISQTYEKIEIVISDDSDNDDTYNFIQPYLIDSRIKYKKNEGLTGRENWLWLIDHHEGDFFNFLLDDDIFASEKIATMVSVYLQYPQISLVTSYRQLIDKAGNILPDINATKSIVAEDSILEGNKIAQALVENELNFIGEPTTVLLKRQYKSLMRKFIDEDSAILDLKTWRELAMLGDVVYLTKPLSFFRMHEGQGQFRKDIQLKAFCNWSELYLEIINQVISNEDKAKYAQLYINNLLNAINLWRHINSELADENKFELTQSLLQSEKLLFDNINQYNAIKNNIKIDPMPQTLANFLTEYTFVNRQQGKKELVLIVAGYKEKLWDTFFARIRKYAPKEVDVCVVVAGKYSERMQHICKMENWSYLQEKEGKISIAQNVAIEKHPYAEFIYKIDEDMFITEYTFSKMKDTFFQVRSDNKYKIGLIVPLVPVNGYGYRRFLEMTDLLDEYQKEFGIAYSASMNIDIVTNGEAARWIWEHTLPLEKSADLCNAVGKVYSICNHRLSIGAIMFSRIFWASMGGFKVEDYHDMGVAEAAVCSYCMEQAYAIICAEKALVGHLCFHQQNNIMLKYYHDNYNEFQC